MEEKQSKAALVKEFYAEELQTDIKSTKASDVAGRITKQIKEILLVAHGGQHNDTIAVVDVKK